MKIGDRLHEISHKMETICMKYQNLFSGKSRKSIINLMSAEIAHRVVKVKAKFDAISVSNRNRKRKVLSFQNNIHMCNKF